MPLAGNRRVDSKQAASRIQDSQGQQGQQGQHHSQGRVATPQQASFQEFYLKSKVKSTEHSFLNEAKHDNTRTSAGILYHLVSSYNPLLG